MSSLKLAPLCLLAILAAACSRAPAPSSPTTPAAAAAISEAQALALLMAQLKAHKVADLDCLEFMDEDDTPANAHAPRWEFAAREIHDARCGGDPAVSHVRDRYQVSATGTVQVYNAAEADYVKF